MLFVTWNEMGPARRAWELAGGALVFGVLCGLALGASLALYLGLSVVAVLGGVLGGAQHDDLRGALLRGLAGGATFGTGVLAGYELGGGTGAVVALPDSAGLFLLFTTLPAFPLHALGRRLGHRLRGGAPAEAALAD